MFRKLCFLPQILTHDTNFVNKYLVRYFRTRIRGQDPVGAKTLAEKLAARNAKDPEIAFKVDIGLPPPTKPKPSEVLARIKLIKAKRSNPELEKAARLLTLNVDLEEVKQEWKTTTAPRDIQRIAEHYGVFDDLFGDAFFTPYVIMDIGFPVENGREAPVHRGNVVKPEEARRAPNVSFPSEPEDLWTLVLTTPDGHLTESNKEVVHWLVGNIPGGEVSKGEVVWKYVQPFPPRGVGFQRFVFVLYKQDSRIDYSAIKEKTSGVNLQDRTFETLEFYRERQDVMTPAGMAFFQSDWDLSVRDAFHKVLDMEEPVFEYDHTPRFLKPERWFPKKKAFNLYLDNFRDPRDISLGYLKEKLKETHPFQRPVKPPKYPNIYPFDRKKTPSWIITERKRTRLGAGRVSHQIEDEY